MVVAKVVMAWTTSSPVVVTLPVMMVSPVKPMLPESVSYWTKLESAINGLNE